MVNHPRILIVEDEQIVAEDLKQTLLELSYEVVGVVESGEAAIEIARAATPNLVLMDIYLEGSIDGIVTAREINRLCHIPVVFLTANSDEEIVSKAKTVGPYGYLLKPYRPRELDATIRLALQQHQLTHELFSKQKWLRTMIESLSDGIIATDSDGRVRYLNGVAEALIGLPLHESIGRDINDVFPITTLGGEPVPYCQLRKAVSTLKPVGRDRFILRNRNGLDIPIEDCAAPILENGVAVGAVSVFLDIGERLRREREAEEFKDRLEEQVHSTTAALGQTRAELRALSGHLMTAMEDERRVVARELHDDFAQRTAFIDMQVAHALDLTPRENSELRELLLEIRNQVSTLSVGLRTTSHRLHPSILHDLGLVTALKILIEEFRENGGEASIRLPDVFPELGLESATTLYRITQEALRNARKHAPGAPVRLTLAATAEVVQLTIEDAGPGFDLSYARSKGGLGLISMQERALWIGGSLFLSTRPGEGTTLSVRIPIIPQ
jgi:PAS domain S-box-containing protein